MISPIKDLYGNLEPWVVQNVFGLQANGSSAYIRQIPFLRFDEKTDFRATVVVCTANNVGVSASFEAVTHQH